MAASLRRWSLRIGLVLVVLIALLCAAWGIFGGSVVAAAVAKQLPTEVAPGLTVQSFSAKSDAVQVDGLLRLAPGRCRSIISEASGRWIPPTVLRSGMMASGRFTSEEVARPLTLAAELGGEKTPALTLSIPCTTINPLLREWCSEPIDFIGDLRMSYRPRLAPRSTLRDAGGLTETSGGHERRLAFDGSGEIDLSSDGQWRTVPVERIAGTIILTFPEKLAGFGLSIQVIVEKLEYRPLPEAAMLSKDAMRVILQKMVNEELAHSEDLAEVTIPSWFPLDLQVDAVTR
jgi:hypothetical protein